jgi:hypothetical protein
MYGNCSFHILATSKFSVYRTLRLLREKEAHLNDDHFSSLLTVAFPCPPAEVPDHQGLHVHRPIRTGRAPWVRRLRPGLGDRGRLPGAALLRALQGPRTSELGRHRVRFHGDRLHLDHPL